MRDEADDVRTWWLGVPPSPEVAARLAEIARVRAQVFLPVVILAITVSLVVSEPAGVPVTPAILVLNLAVLTTAITVFVGLRRDWFPASQSHAIGALVWLLAPITTLVSTMLTDVSTLTLPLMIELASLPILIETRWALIPSIPVVATALALMTRSETLGIFAVAVVGVWILGVIMQIALRRSMIRIETHRLDLQHALERLERELGERQRAEADREALRDQFVHAQRMDAVGTLSAGLAHDMNNILGGILAFAEILRAQATDPETREDLDRIRHEAERGAALTRGLLAFSRRGAYRKRAISLGGVIDDMAPLLARTLGKNIKLERTDGAIAIVEGDPAQLGQILLNLGLNAADAMDGTGTIWIATDVVELAANEVGTLPAGSYAKLSVTDTGVGMDEATRLRMFEPFFTTKAVGKGTGLGLAMVYGAIEAHGGAIGVASAPGKGTTIEIYVPTVEAAVERPKRASTNPSLLRGVVLIVDDEATMRAGTARIIEQLGLSALTASDGDEALAVFDNQRGDIALVLLDMAMPRMTGAECFKALRQRANVPILLMSGYTDHTAAKALLEAGANGFLEKPFTVEQLGTEVDRLLGRRARTAGAPPA